MANQAPGPQSLKNASGHVTGVAINGNYLGVPSDAVHGRTVFVPASVANNNPSYLQEVHDSLKAAGGGNIVLEAGTVYTPTSVLNLDSSYCGLRMNGAKVNISGIGDGNFWLNVYGSSDVHDEIGAVNREISGGWIYGSHTMGLPNGVGAIRFNSPDASTSNRIVVRSMRVINCFRGVSYKDRSYFVFWYDSYIKGCGVGIYGESGPSDFAESNTFINCVLAENDTHLQDVGGNVWRFYSGSMDYHRIRLLDLRAGSCVSTFGTHFEWRYGGDPSETNAPFKLQDSNSGLYVKGGCMAYTGIGQNPYYIAHIELNNSSQTLDIQLDKPFKLGRLTDTTGLDCFAYATSAVAPYVRIRAQSQGNLKADVPAMSYYSYTGSGDGVGGKIRFGQSNLIAEMSHRTAVTGTASISGVTADENGVIRKGGANMLKLLPGGTPAGSSVVITFPMSEMQRRHAWQFFTNEAFLTGAVTIKERYTSYAPKFNGTTIVNTVDGKGAIYGTTITINGTSSGVSVWNRRNWKDTSSANTFGNSPPVTQSLSTLVTLEIDLSGVTAGALYLTWPAFDVL